LLFFILVYNLQHKRKARNKFNTIIQQFQYIYQ
jgi:hypothetical protein